MGKRVLFVWPSARPQQAVWPPFGISYVASYLAAHEPEVSIKVVDFGMEQFSPERWRQELRLYEPDIVGISILMLNAANGMELARLTKEVNPGITTVLGGVNASIYPHKCLKSCDIVVRGEGEETFHEIVQGHDLETIKGISYVKDGEVFDTPYRGRLENLDSLPFPLISLFDMERYLGQGFRVGSVLGSRGCPYGCTFCASQHFWSRIIKFRSAENIVDEIEFLHGRYRLDRMGFGDDAFNIYQKRGFEICDEIIKRGLQKKLQFITLARANRKTVSPELFQRMKEANFTEVSLGIESASPRVLKAMKKNLMPEEASQTIRMARKAGISSVVGNFMVGNWDETIGDVLKTWRFVLSHNVEPLFWICTPYPGTEFSLRLTESGYLDSEGSWLANFRPGVYAAVTRTNKMTKISITIVYFISVFLQIMLLFFRARKYKKFWFFSQRAIVETWRKVRLQPAEWSSSMKRIFRRVGNRSAKPGV